MIQFLPHAIIAAIVLAGLTGWQGYRLGYDDAEDAHRVELLDQIEAGKKLEAARVAEAKKRETLARQLEEQAHADPIVVERCLGPDRVQRLNAIR